VKPAIINSQLTYFILSRSIFDSPIWGDNPHVLKIFLYLVGTARHDKKPKRYPKVTIKRGELVTSLKKIADDNSYMKNNVVKTLSRQRLLRILILLSEQNYIKRISDTYGTHISICNYDAYQSPASYKADTGVQVAYTPRTPPVHVPYINNNGNNVNNDNKKDSAKSFKQYSEKELIIEIKTIIFQDLKMKEFFNEKETSSFIDYWVEKGTTGKMRFQLEKTWETKRRMSKWKNNNFNKEAKNGNGKTSTTFRNSETDHSQIKQSSGY